MYSDYWHTNNENLLVNQRYANGSFGFDVGKFHGSFHFESKKAPVLINGTNSIFKYIGNHCCSQNTKQNKNPIEFGIEQ